MAEHAAYDVWRRADDTLVARIYGRGPTPAAAVANAVQAFGGDGLAVESLKTATLEELDRLGMPIDDAQELMGKQALTVRVSRSTLRKAKARARAERRSFASLVELALEAYCRET